MSRVAKLVGGALVAGLTLGLPNAASAEGSFSAGDWLVRARGIVVSPDESSTITVIGGKAHADTSVVPEVDFTYFATDNIAFELIAAVTKHDVEARGTSLGAAPVDLGSAWLLPPTLTVQYHMNSGAFSPYVGAGVNYTTMFNVNKPKAGPVTAISYGDSFGPALQAGFDVWVSDTTTLNFDVKKIWLNTNVKVNGGAIKGDVDLDPWVIGVGFGYKF